MAQQTPLQALTQKYAEVFHEEHLLDMKHLLELSKKHTLYCFFIMPRSGSTWLGELMAGTKTLGMPNEWLNQRFIFRDNISKLGFAPPKIRGTADINKYFSHIAEDGNGTAGVQLSYWQCMALRPLLKGALPVRNIHWFYLRRRDIVEQAISLYKSLSTGVWHSFEQSHPSPNPDKFDVTKAVEDLTKLVVMEQRFETLMAECGIDPLRLFYEDIQTDPLAALKKIATNLNGPPPSSVPTATLRILRDHNSMAWKKELGADPRVLDILKKRPALQMQI
jgi:LPS sulfotransferase NodH